MTRLKSWRAVVAQFFIGYLGFAMCASTEAAIINLDGGTIQHTLGTGGTFATDFVDIAGYRFETFQGGVLSFNTNNVSGFNIHSGGLLYSTALGVGGAIKISRLDGMNFALESFTFFDHAFIACGAGYCGHDPDTVNGYPTPASNFSVGLPYNPTNNTYEFFNAQTTDSRFGNVNSVIVSLREAYILDDISVSALSTAPIPSTAWLLLAGLGAMGYRLGRRA